MLKESGSAWDMLFDFMICQFACCPGDEFHSFTMFRQSLQLARRCHFEVMNDAKLIADVLHGLVDVDYTLTINVMKILSVPRTSYKYRLRSVIERENESE